MTAPGSMLQVVAYTVMAPGGPFPLMCLAFGFAGFALALQTSQANGFVGCLGDPSTKLGLLHAAYGQSSLTGIVLRMALTVVIVLVPT